MNLTNQSLGVPSISQALIDKYRRSPPNFDLDKEQFPSKDSKIRTLKDGNIEIVTRAIGPAYLKISLYMIIKKRLLLRG